MKIATLPKSGTYLFQNMVDYLKNDRGIKIELDHILMPNRPDFIDEVTPTIVTSRDPRGYFYSLLNWYNQKSNDLLTGTISEEQARRYFDPDKIGRWVEMTNDERLLALIYDTIESLMVVPSRASYDELIKAQSKSNCYITTFEKFAPQKDSSMLGADAIVEYLRMFDHLGVKMDERYAKEMISACWGHSETYTPNGVNDWKRHFSKAVQTRIIDHYRDVYDAFGYVAEYQDAVANSKVICSVNGCS
jgi:hypothetical protein